MFNEIISDNLSSFNIDLILRSNYSFCRHLIYFYQCRFLCSLLKIVLQFQSRHNSHTGHCYVMLFDAGKRLDVIITIIKTVQCYVSCPPCMQKVWVRNFFARSVRENPHLYCLNNQNNILCYRRFDFTSEGFIRTDFR